MEDMKNAGMPDDSLNAENNTEAAIGNTAAQPKATSRKKAAGGKSSAKKSASDKPRAKSGAESPSAKTGANSAPKGDEEKALSEAKAKKPSSKRVAKSEKNKIAENEMQKSNSITAEPGVATDTELAVFSIAEEFDDAEALIIEREAIASLPVAEVEPELLLCDTGEIEDTHESAEEAARYEEYLKEYQSLMAEMLKNAKAAAEELSPINKAEKTEDNDSETSSLADASATDNQILGSGDVPFAPEDISDDENCESEKKEEDSKNIRGEEPIFSESAEELATQDEDDGNAENGDSIEQACADSEAEDFDPLSTISLLEYVPSLLGTAEENESEDWADGEVSEDEIYEDEAEGLSPEYSEYESDEYIEDDEPEQLQMSFGGDDSTKDVPDKNIYNPKKPRGIDSLFDLIELFVLTFAAIMFITTFFFRHSVIDGRSMENTLSDGDVVIISDFFYTPGRGDIVVLDDQSKSDEVLIKRIIAIEGDHILVKADGRVYLNGNLLREDYVYESNEYHIYKEQEWTLKKGEIFVLGDHRDVSEDSEDFGPVSADSILGKVLFRILPFENFGGLD